MLSSKVNGNGHGQWDGLGRAFELAGGALYETPAGLAFSAAEDPLQLNLPPLGGSGSDYALTAPSLRLIATLYMQAELEQAGIIPVAELLVQQRDTLALHDRASMARLEDFALRSRRWYDRQTRDLLFARLFGIGPGAGDGSDTTANHDFMRRLAALCAAILAYARSFVPGRLPDYGAMAVADAAVRYAGGDLVVNLGPRQFGNTLLAGQVIQDQLQAAIAILSAPEIEALLGSHGFWETLQNVLGEQCPDLGRLAARAQNGIRLLNWLASIIPQLDPSGSGSRPLLPSGSPVFDWAGAWLAAAGLAPAADAAPAASGMEDPWQP